jgi:hypothetical protein
LTFASAFARHASEGWHPFLSRHIEAIKGGVFITNPDGGRRFSTISACPNRHGCQPSLA